MTSPDFRTFVGTLIPGHRGWLTANPSPSGDQFFDHYVGDPLHPDGLLWLYEAWRAEHGYSRVRPWNGTELLGRTPTPDIPSPGLTLPWAARTAPPAPAPAGPAFTDSFLAEGTTTADLQAHFGVANTNALGAAIFVHWNAARSFPTPFDSEIEAEETAPYSIRFWGFMKWASILRNRVLGIPVFAIPIVFDADGVPMSDIEFSDVENRWHRLWHGGASACTQVTSAQMGNPFAPSDSPFGQFCSRFGLPGEFPRFHRDLLNTYDDWRRRAGMPRVERWKPPELHFHSHPQIPEIPPSGLELSEDPAVQYAQIRDLVMHFNTLESMAAYAEGELHGAGHGAPESDDIADINTNNYSPRFMAWHRWIDYLWEVRQPRFDSFRPVASDGTDYPSILTIVRPTPNPDRIEPNNALTGLTGDGRGSLWIMYRLRPETWGRAVTLTISGEVFRNSSDLNPVSALAAAPVVINVPVAQQGVDSAPVEIPFTALDAGEGAFARENLPGGAVGFKNGRIRIAGRLVPVGNVPGSHAIGDPNDQFDHEEHVDIILVKETRPPVVSAILNKSAFSVDEVTVTAAGSNQSPFVNSFFVVLQDPPEPPPALGTSSIFADPARTAVSGIFADLSVKPTVEVVDEGGNVVNWFTVVATDVFKEEPSLPDNVSQRVLFRYLVLFNDVAAFSALLPNAGDVRYARLRTSARDRSGNAVQNQLSPPIKLFRDANPYMIDVLDQNPVWLSIDTRVFSVRHTEPKFGHRVDTSGGPNEYIKDVINQFNAGTQNFDAIPADAGQAPLELMPTVSGDNVYNFTLARVRMRTQVAISGVRVFFRLFTTAVSNLSFNATNYPTSVGASPIALLGRTSPGAEIVSIPFLAESRKETRDSMPDAVSMTAQTDPANVQLFAVTPPGGETIRYFGAYLDINSDTERYPAAPSGDGPFPTSQCVSIRNIIRGQHQCMVAEVFYAGDLTEPNATPGTSDNLAQRNLLIIESANPGHQATHTVQHSFDIALPNRKERDRIHEEFRRQRLAQRRAQVQGDETAKPAIEDLELSALAGAPLANVLPLATSAASAAVAAWRDPGFDELVFFWNNLPRDTRVEVYLPSLDVESVMLLRSLRRAPQTVRLSDEHTLSLKVDGVTYLPIPNLGQERVAGLLTVTLPDTIRAGEVYTLDVLQMRASMGTILGAFRLTIPVSKAARIYAREARLLEVFEERLKVIPPVSRWHPIILKQVEYFRARTDGLAEEAADECAQAPEKGKGTRLRVILEKVKVLDFHGPLVHGSGRVSLIARVTTTNAGGIGRISRLPTTGTYQVLDRPKGYVIDINKEVFRGTVVDNLAVEIFSAESEEAAHVCYYRREFKGKADQWLGSYKPSDQRRDPENVGDWQVWYRIEEL